MLFVGDSNPIWKTHTCNFLCKSDGESKRCGLVFPSRNKLNAHKVQADHLQRKRKSGSSSKVATSEPKQLRLDDMLQAHAEAEDQAADSDTEKDEGTCNLCKIGFVCMQ